MSKGKGKKVVSTKSSVAAGLLGIILGGLGVHDFYLGYNKLGVAHLVMVLGGWVVSVFVAAIALSVESAEGAGNVGNNPATVALAWSLMIGYVLTFASWAWGFVEGVMCLMKMGKYGKDAAGAKTI